MRTEKGRVSQREIYTEKKTMSKNVCVRERERGVWNW